MNEIFVSNAFADSASETSAKGFHSSFVIRNSSFVIALAQREPRER